MSPTQGPGKLAPALIQDLQLYDPTHPLANGLNVLRDVPLYYSGHESVASLLPAESCRHSWCAKDSQEVLPPLDARPGPDTHHIFAGVCRRCRIHVELETDYSVGWQSEPCPNAAYPLHHFIHSPRRGTVARSDRALGGEFNSAETFAFGCSSPVCSATVFVRLRPPVLENKHIRLLTDRALLNERTEEVIESAPAQFEGYKKPNPVDVLSDLRSYLKRSFEHGEPKAIRAHKNRFALRFGVNGEACKDVLVYLGFKYEPQECWLPPQSNADDSAPFKDSINIFIDNVIWEINILISQLPEEERRQIQEITHLPDAEKSLLRVVGAQDYEKHPSSRTTILDPAARQLHFAALGSTQDASDELVSFAYQQQIRTNAKESPTYLSYLRHIASDRKSELLQTLLATEYSRGNIDAEELNEAYRYFSLSPRDAGITDEVIIGTFDARLQDSRKQEAEMRAHLKTIGQHRRSQRIQDVASNALYTYEQAMVFFDAVETTPDEFIPTLYTSKTTENPSIVESARKAVRLIAEGRGSDALQNWLRTGELGENSMDISEAYRMLGVQDSSVDDGLVESAYKSAVGDNPNQSAMYTKAFDTINAQRQSSQVQATSRGSQSLARFGQPNWPVGLENIGNTCYLNSLLQFLFTIPELRNLVLHFDNVKMELTPENIATKRVGSRQISVREIQRAQQFVLKLRELFLEMIKSPFQYIAPEQELARLTLMTSTAAENIRRRSTIGGSRPLGTVHGLPVLGPLGPPPEVDKENTNDHAILSPFEGDKMASSTNFGAVQDKTINSSDWGRISGSSDAPMDVSADNSSEVTLVSNPSIDDLVMVDGVAKPEQRYPLNDKENLPPRETNGRDAGDTADENTKSLIEKAPLEPRVEHATDAASAPSAVRKDVSAKKLSPEPPSRPPPIPPRPTPAPELDHSLEEYARQQDVTEVLNHVLFQLSCAIKPIAFDEEGEQVDQIKDLFYGKTKQHIMSEDKDEAKNDRFCSIIVRLFTLPHDIYAALDGYFDVEEIANKKRFLSISQLPPIFQVQIDRAGLDQKKNNHHVELKETIYLDRYLEEDTNPALMERRQEAWMWKKELADLEARRLELTADQSHPDPQTTFYLARDALMHFQELSSKSGDGFEIDTSAIATLESLAEQTQLQLQDISFRCKDLATNINSQFADSAFRRHAYRLHAAFFHHGSASSGHYWIYIYDFRTEVWLKYNDTRVEEVKDTNEIFRRPSEAEYNQWNGPSNPYYLVYVRDEDKDKLVESVCRDIQMPAVPPDDTEMVDVAGGSNQWETTNAQKAGGYSLSEDSNEDRHMAKLRPLV